jgi:hypothetical protein
MVPSSDLGGGRRGAGVGDGAVGVLEAQRVLMATAAVTPKPAAAGTSALGSAHLPARRRGRRSSLGLSRRRWGRHRAAGSPACGRRRRAAGSRRNTQRVAAERLAVVETDPTQTPGPCRPAGRRSRAVASRPDGHAREARVRTHRSADVARERVRAVSAHARGAGGGGALPRVEVSNRCGCCA